ncbi:MAG: cyanophycinase [Betaproteobacteria bacterium]
MYQLSLTIRVVSALMMCLTAAPTLAQGIAIPIGGALKYDNHEVWSRLVALAGGKGAHYAVFATASGSPDKTAALIVDALTKNGAIAEYIPISAKLATPDFRDAVADPALIAKVRASTGIFFSGGAQERITDALLLADGKPTPMLQAIWDVYNRGGVVAGTSAGAAIMSTTMIRDAQDVLSVLKNGARQGREIDRGLGFAGPNIFVDQHFLKRGRFGRMLPVMLQTGYKLGLGVDENTAAIIRGDEVEVIGFKGAMIVDLTDATRDKAVKEFNIRNAKLTYLDRGDRYNFKTRTTIPSAAKLKDKKIDPNDKGFAPYFTTDAFYPDVLGDTVVVHLMSNLIDNKQQEVIGLAFNPSVGKDAKPELGFEFRFRKGTDSLGYFTSSFGGEDYTVTNIYLDVNPVRMSNPLYRVTKPGRSGANY